MFQWLMFFWKNMPQSEKNQDIGQRKAFYRQRISESSCARKETVNIDILVTSRNGDRKIMQSIRITSRPTSRKKKTKIIPMKRLKLATFQWWTKGPKQVAREGPTVLHICFCSYLTIPSSNWEHQPRCNNSIPHMDVW